MRLLIEAISSAVRVASKVREPPASTRCVLDASTNVTTAASARTTISRNGRPGAGDGEVPVREPVVADQRTGSPRHALERVGRPLECRFLLRPGQQAERSGEAPVNTMEKSVRMNCLSLLTCEIARGGCGYRISKTEQRS